MGADMTPEESEELSEVLQEHDRPELLLAAVPVRHDGPIQTRELPSRLGISKSRSVPDTETWKALSADPRRKSATLIAASQPFYVAQDKDLVSGGQCAQWPSSVALVITHQEAVYVRCATTSNSTIVSVLSEQWTE